MVQIQRAVVWDLDGVIVDSAEAHNISWTDMAAEFKVPYNPEKDFKTYFGRHNNDIISSMWGVTDSAQLQRMADRKEELFREAAHRLQPLPGVVALVKALDAAGWAQGIGSSAPIENVRLLLSVTGLEKYMRAIASGADVTVGKPDPAVFRIAFERLEVDPVNGVVIEDAPAGVQAAKRAGAACLAVTNTQAEQTLVEAGADRIVSTLEGITVPDLETLVQANKGSARARKQ